MSGDHNMYCSGNQPDIVERLREYGVKHPQQTWDWRKEAADEIESLRRRLQDGSPVVEGTIQHMAMEIAALKKERDELKSCIDNDRELFDVPIYVKQLEAKLDECVTTIKEYARREECEGFYSSVAHKALAKLADKGEK